MAPLVMGYKLVPGAVARRRFTGLSINESRMFMKCSNSQRSE